jgi:hypothetical protein
MHKGGSSPGSKTREDDRLWDGYEEIVVRDEGDRSWVGDVWRGKLFCVWDKQQSAAGESEQESESDKSRASASQRESQRELEA